MTTALSCDQESNEKGNGKDREKNQPKVHDRGSIALKEQMTKHVL